MVTLEAILKKKKKKKKKEKEKNTIIFTEKGKYDPYE